MWNYGHKIAITLAYCLLALSLSAQVQSSNIQPKLNSPLSRFGLGDPVDQFFAAQSGLGGLSTAWQDPFHINILNPASLASLQATAFEGGFNIRRSTLVGASDEKASIWGGNLQYLALAFPLRNSINTALDRQSNEWNAGMGIVLSPFTQVGYDIELKDSSTPGVELSTNTLKGTGGTYRLQWGSGFRYKGLSVGADVGFLFGKLTYSRLVEFDSLINALETEFLDDLSVRGTTWNFGAQYAFDFMEVNDEGEREPSGRRVILGATLGTTTKLNTETQQFARRYLGGVVSDTLFRESEVMGEGKLPGELSFGVTYQDQNKFMVGAEFAATKWSNYENSSKPESFSDTWRVGLGIEWIPDFSSYNNYWEKVRYRAGMRYGSDPRSVNGEQVEYLALTIGAGLPIILPRQQISFINAGLEFGQVGVADALQEKYVKLTLGFTLNDNSWFFKRKFN